MEAREKKWKKKIDSPFRRATEKAHLHGSFAYAERDGGVAMATRLTHIASMFLFVRARACACVCYRVFFYRVFVGTGFDRRVFLGDFVWRPTQFRRRIHRPMAPLAFVGVVARLRWLIDRLADDFRISTR